MALGLELFYCLLEDFFLENVSKHLCKLLSRCLGVEQGITMEKYLVPFKCAFPLFSLLIQHLKLTKPIFCIPAELPLTRSAVLFSALFFAQQAYSQYSATPLVRVILHGFLKRKACVPIWLEFFEHVVNAWEKDGHRIPLHFPTAPSATWHYRVISFVSQRAHYKG